MSQHIAEEVGLTSAEVALQVAAGRVNRLPDDSMKDYADILGRNTLTLFNALVIPAAFALFILGDYRGAWAVSGMAVANTILGLAHEMRAKRHLDKISWLAETRVCVRRNGSEQTIRSSEVVSGELVLLAPGETVVADGPVISSSFLELDEALLTGESDPVALDVGDTVKSGSVCVAGEGAYRAERVSREAFAQKTAAAARKYRHAPGPTQRTLDQLVKWLTALAVGLCLGYIALFYLRGFSTTDLVQMVAATITSLVPQGLVLLTTLVFVLAASRLSDHGAVVQQLTAVEGLAALDVLCTDKTGTLTTGRLTLGHLQTFAKPESTIRPWLGAFACASVDRRNKSIEAIREALGAEALKVEVLDQVSFQSRNRFSAMMVRYEGQSRLLVLGSVEALRHQMSDQEGQAVETVWKKLLPTGLRLILFAEGSSSSPLNGGLPAVSLRPLALIALQDELRPGVSRVLSTLEFNNIRLKVVSGDHPETVRATVDTLGSAFAGSTLITGNEWEQHQDRAVLADQCHVYGRVSPGQKLALVEALQQAGRNVGMIGDGVNDILPIKRADFGIAMGSGSPATKAVAGVVLESNDFAALPAILVEGRRVVKNVRQAAKLFLLKITYTITLILVAVGLCGLPFPYLPQQVTLLNGLTIGGPAILILARRSTPTGAIKSSFFADVGRFILIAGFATSTVGLTIYLGSWYAFQYEAELARTMLLATLIIAGIGNAIVATNRDRKLVAWSIFAVAVLALAINNTTLAYFFAFTPLTVKQWMVAILAAVCAVTILFIFSQGDVHADENQ